MLKPIGKATLLCLASVLISSLASAGNIFLSRFGGPNFERGLSVVETSDGGYAVAGWTTSFGAGALLVKFDSSGDVEWSRVWGGSSNAESVIQTVDGGYVVAGYTSSFGEGLKDGLVSKFSSSGDHLWTKVVGGERNEEFRGVTEASDGGLVLTGYTTSVQDGSIWPTYAVLVKFNASGNHLWTRVTGEVFHDEYMGNSVVETSDGGYAIAGGFWDIYVTRFDGSGTHIWTRTLEDVGANLGESLVQAEDGGFVVTGDMRDETNSHDDIFLAKLDGSGNHLWTTTISGGDYDWGRSLIRTADGEYLVAGSTDSYSGDDNTAFIFAKFDGSGIHLWTRMIDIGPQYIAESIVQASDGGYAIAGWGSTDLVLAKADSLGVTCTGEFIGPDIVSRSPTVDDKSVDSYAASLTVSGVSPTITDPGAALSVVCSNPPNVVGDCESELFSSLTDWTNGDGLTLMYDDGSHGDAAAGDGVYTIEIESAAEDFPLGPTGGQQVVGTHDEWSPQFPGSWTSNVPVAFSQGGAITFYFDRNVYSDGFLPESCIVYNSWMPTYAWPGPHYVVGSCQTEFGASSDWNQTDTTMRMNDSGVDGDVSAGDLVYTFQAGLGTPGSYEFKVLNSYGSWVPQYSAEGFVWDNGSNMSFTSTAPGEIVMFETDIETGRTRVTVEPAPMDEFIRSDADADMDVEMSDAIFTLKYLYVPGAEEPPCMDGADADDGGVVEMSDAIYTLKYLYVPGSPAPPAPGPNECGSDPTEDGLGCGSHPCMGSR